MRKPGDKLDNNKALSRMARKLDNLAAFEEFEATILPALRKDLKSGLTAQQILEKYQGHAAAVLASGMFLSGTPADARAAAKELLDRVQGKPTERRELTHKLDRMPEKDIDALLVSKLDRIGSGGDDEESAEE